MRLRYSLVMGFALSLTGACGDDGASTPDVGTGADSGSTDTGTEGDATTTDPGGGNDATTAACDTDLVGSWSLVSIGGGGPPADPENSTLTFAADGQYTWCLNYAGYVRDGGGTYAKEGALVTLDGSLLEVVGMSPITLFDCEADRFSFNDDEADTWTYQRNPEASGCAP